MTCLSYNMKFSRMESMQYNHSALHPFMVQKEIHVVMILGSSRKYRKWIYIFFVSINTADSKSHINLDIVHNDISKVRTILHSSASLEGNKPAVLELNKGDTLWVRRYDGASYHSSSVPITTYSRDCRRILDLSRRFFVQTII